MEEVAHGGTVEILQYLHANLDAHFRALNLRRQALNPTSPVFALEHDLSDVDLDLLRAAVRAAVAAGFGVRFFKGWLPFVVYAAEIGYDYVGLEYWPLFAERTPGWETRPGWNLYGARKRIKQWFQQFADKYGGITPTGAFAENFNIIAWPISNAVMPSYLQRQLAQLLYESRAVLTTELLGDPEALGVRLAARTGGYSERFQIFCSNNGLLGQVAAGLLSGDDDETPYLVRSTLQRLVAGLSSEQQSRLWLARARQSAHQVRSSGFLPRTGGVADQGQRRQLMVTDPTLLLRKDNAFWHAYVELPDLTPLEGLAAPLAEELRTLGARVQGHDRLLARGRLMYPGEVVLSSWPAADVPFLQLERGAEASNDLIARHCSISPGPWWLFRIRDGGEAVEVKGKVVRPGHRYALVGSGEIGPPQVEWLDAASIATERVSMYEMTVPPAVTESDAAALQGIGLNVVSEVSIRPAGLVACAWDGEGAVDWLAGEPALLAIRSTCASAKCVVRVGGGAPFMLDWPADNAEMLLALEDLPVGTHELEVSLLGAAGVESVTAGSLLVTIRDPHATKEGSSSGEGIRVYATPARPKLAELWDQRATLSIDGPPGVKADLSVVLRDAGGRELSRLRRSVDLPLSDAAWTRFARQELRGTELSSSYDEAESCEVAVSRSGVGFASLVCERGFRPLRWVVRNRRGKHVARLIDRTDGDNTTVQLFPVHAPVLGEKHDPERDIPSPVGGGLLLATSGAARAAIVLPPDPNQLRQMDRQLPAISLGAKSRPEILRLIDAHYEWLEADLPGDPFARYQQEQVLDAITTAIVSAIAGGRWAHLERRYRAADDPLDLLADMQDLVGEAASQRVLAKHVADHLWRWAQGSTDLTEGFAEVIGSMAAERGILCASTASNFLLRLASRPGHLASWDPADRDRLLEVVLTSPVLLRAARFAVLGTDGLQADASAHAVKVSG